MKFTEMSSHEENPISSPNGIFMLDKAILQVSFCTANVEKNPIPYMDKIEDISQKWYYTLMFFLKVFVSCLKTYYATACSTKSVS